MRTYSANTLKKIGMRVFSACGASAEDAAIVADELVCANLMGFDSHGVIRYLQYTEDVLNDRIKPGAPTVIIKETQTTAIVDCGFNFGQVSATRMAHIVAEKARQMNIACAISVHCHHIGRLGSFVQKLAERDLIGIATVNSSRHGHWVAPWGGREGRLATNPIAYAVPTNSKPIILDMSTAMIAEGKLRLLRNQGKTISNDSILDHAGNPSKDPNAFYGPPGGTILPFGGDQGYKGFGLSLLVEILGSALAGQEMSDYGYVNGLCIIAINPEALCGSTRLKRLTDELSAYITSCPPAPGCKEVVMPGTTEYDMMDRRLREGIPIDEETWGSIEQAANKVGVGIDIEMDLEGIIR